MTFLAPVALLGLLLLAVPVIVHLLRPRKMRHTPFSSLRWLKVTRQRLSLRTAKGVTDPGSTPRSSRISSAEPKENRPDAPRRRCSERSSITASSEATTR